MGVPGGRLGESQRRNGTTDMLGRVKPPPGVDPDVWPGMVAADPARAFELYIRTLNRAGRKPAG